MTPTSRGISSVWPSLTSSLSNSSKAKTTQEETNQPNGQRQYNELELYSNKESKPLCKIEKSSNLFSSKKKYTLLINGEKFNWKETDDHGDVIDRLDGLAGLRLSKAQKDGLKQAEKLDSQTMRKILLNKTPQATKSGTHGDRTGHNNRTRKGEDGFSGTPGNLIDQIDKKRNITKSSKTSSSASRFEFSGYKPNSLLASNSTNTRTNPTIGRSKSTPSQPTPRFNSDTVYYSKTLPRGQRERGGNGYPLGQPANSPQSSLHPETKDLALQQLVEETGGNKLVAQYRLDDLIRSGVWERINKLANEQRKQLNQTDSLQSNPTTPRSRRHYS